MIFQKELILTKQVHQKNASFVIVGTFKDVGFKFEPHVCNKCHDVLITAYALNYFRCILWGISRSEGLRRLNNSVLEDKGVL